MSFEWFNSETKDLNFLKSNSNRLYQQYSYSHLIYYFKGVGALKKENLVIGAHAVYGWMSTILNLTKNEKDLVLMKRRINN